MNTFWKICAALMLTIYSNGKISAQQLNFPADFATKAHLWQPLLPATVTDEMREAGITQNPFQTNDSETISQLCGECGTGVSGYLEVYRSRTNEHDDAEVRKCWSR